MTLFLCPFGQVECANDQIGFGKRKRRSVATRHPDKAQKVYEISASTIIKVASIPERSAEVIEEQVDSRLLRSPAAVARRADDFDPNDDHRVDFDQVAEEQQAFLAEKGKRSSRFDHVAPTRTPSHPLAEITESLFVPHFGNDAT